MPRQVTAMSGVWVVFAVCGAMEGCAGSGERLPQCRGRTVPINAVSTTSAAGQATVSSTASAERDAVRGGAHHVE
jgi:hypothetical protein